MKVVVDMMREARQLAMGTTALARASGFAMNVAMHDLMVFEDQGKTVGDGNRKIPDKFCGIPIGIDPRLPDDVIELRGAFETIRIKV